MVTRKFWNLCSTIHRLPAPNLMIPSSHVLLLEFVIVNLNVDSVCSKFISDKSCDFGEYYNELNWEVDSDGDCDEDVKSYNIYFSETGVEGTFELT